jgi:hypothetical protein
MSHLCPATSTGKNARRVGSSSPPRRHSRSRLLLGLGTAGHHNQRYQPSQCRSGFLKSNVFRPPTSRAKNNELLQIHNIRRFADRPRLLGGSQIKIAVSDWVQRSAGRNWRRTCRRRQGFSNHSESATMNAFQGGNHAVFKDNDRIEIEGPETRS